MGVETETVRLNMYLSVALIDQGKILCVDPLSERQVAVYVHVY